MMLSGATNGREGGLLGKSGERSSGVHRLVNTCWLCAIARSTPISPEPAAAKLSLSASLLLIIVSSRNLLTVCSRMIVSVSRRSAWRPGRQHRPEDDAYTNIY